MPQIHQTLPVLILTSLLLGGSVNAVSHNKSATTYGNNTPSPDRAKTSTIKKQISNAINDKIVCNTMPKCGTHLLLKCLTLLEQPGISYNYQGLPGAERYKPKGKRLEIYNRLNRFDPPHHYKGEFHIPTVGPVPTGLIHRMITSKNRLLWGPHWPYTKEAEAEIAKRTVANFFIIRDPRDMIISMAFMVKDGFNGESYPVVDDLIYDFIDGRQKHFIRWGVEVHSTYPLLWELGVVGFYKLYLPWMKARKFHTVRFENLIGCEGGGSNVIQMEEIRLIAEHIGVNLSQEKIKKIRDALFGGTSTFREGKSSGWKKYFTPEMKQAFKNAPGANQLLIDLGYEKDAHW